MLGVGTVDTMPAIVLVAKSLSELLVLGTGAEVAERSGPAVAVAPALATGRRSALNSAGAQPTGRPRFREKVYDSYKRLLVRTLVVWRLFCIALLGGLATGMESATVGRASAAIL